MLDTTIIQQGTFTKTNANDVYLAIRSDVDWMQVYNFTNIDAPNGDANGRGSHYYWQRGMASGRGFRWFKSNGSTILNLDTLDSPNGFTLTDSSIFVLNTRNALTAITAANPPVITTAATLPNVGDIVRVDTLDNQPQIGGMEFTVTASGGGTFTIGNINLTNSTASTAGFWRRIDFDPIFYPRKRFITYISSAAQAKVYMSVTHQFTVGQEIRLVLEGGSALWGDWAQLNGVSATIVAVGEARAGNEPNNGGTANSITLDIDTSGFTTWETTFGAANNEAFPASGDVPFSHPVVVPVGEDTAIALANNVDILEDATENRAFLGMRLGGGTNSVGPAGTTNDVIYWVAGKSFSNTSGILTTF